MTKGYVFVLVEEPYHNLGRVRGVYQTLASLLDSAALKEIDARDDTDQHLDGTPGIFAAKEDDVVCLYGSWEPLFGSLRELANSEWMVQ